MSVDEPGRVTPSTEEGARPESSLPEVLDRLAERAAAELDSAELTVAGGDQVRIVSLPEVQDWLRGQASRARAGVPL